MTDAGLLSRIRFREPTKHLAEKGLVAWCDVQHGALWVHGVELRRTAAGALAISFPPAREFRGRLSCSARPASDAARNVLQREIIAAAAREGWLR